MTKGPSEPGRRLIVLRHAKSDWPAGVADKDRPLAKRGRRDAPAAGEWLAENLGSLDLTVHSDARRARETWECAAAAFAAAGGRVGSVRSARRVYLADVDALIEVLRSVPDDAETVLLVGHNPGVQDLVVELVGARSSSSAALIDAKFPTTGLAVLDIPVPWSGLGPDCAELAEFVVPRG